MTASAAPRLGCAAAVVAVAGACVACTPALDWRDVRPPGSGVSTQFPCRPVVQEREVALAGAAVRLALHACAAGGSTWALAHADVADPARVAPALEALATASAGNVGAPAVPLQPFAVPGATPSASAGRVGATGRRPDGAPLVLHAVVFAHGTRVLQATVLGERPDAAAVETFFGALRVPP